MRPAFGFGAILAALFGAIWEEAVSTALQKAFTALGIGIPGSKVTFPALILLAAYAAFEIRPWWDNRTRPIERFKNYLNLKLKELEKFKKKLKKYPDRSVNYPLSSDDPPERAVMTDENVDKIVKDFYKTWRPKIGRLLPHVLIEGDFFESERHQFAHAGMPFMPGLIDSVIQADETYIKHLRDNVKQVHLLEKFDPYILEEFR